ncbi:MAG: hypothetical protein ABSF00_10335 [Candidatus Bathyarchaeia archaeon]
MSIIPGLVGSAQGKANVVTKSVTTTVTAVATASSVATATTDLTYDYNLSQTMVGGQPAWFRSCTWGEFPVIAGGTGTGSPPIAFIGGDPELQQTVHVQYWSDLPVDLYFLTRDQELSWLYYTSLWPYQFCAPPFSSWTFGWENTTYASFTASLPAGTCPCSILMFNMNATEAHVRFVVNGLEISVSVPYQHATTSTSTDTYMSTKKIPPFQVNSEFLASVGLVSIIIALLGIWIRARPTKPLRRS